MAFTLLLARQIKMSVMKRNSTLLILIVLVSLTSCHRYYTNSSFDQKAARHKTIAVLPPKMVLTGNQPKSLTEADIAKLEEKESRYFQESLYNNILAKSNQGKYEMYVSVQPPANTLSVLEKNNISIRDSWSKDDQELANMLGVDAIVRSSIQKSRIMSDLASAGIEVGRRIADAVLNRPTTVGMGVNKTNDIQATCSVVSNGETLWNDTYQRDSNFANGANEVIENITSKFAKHFPYRKKA